MEREIIQIDEEKCDGCGNCVPNCHEGALQIIDEKAVLISDLMCDGLGACIGHCPQDALTIEKREAEPYDEIAVMKEMIQKGKNVVTAHMKHLKDHQEHTFLKQGVQFLLENKEKLDFNPVEIIQEVHLDYKCRADVVARVPRKCPSRPVARPNQPGNLYLTSLQPFANGLFSCTLLIQLQVISRDPTC